MRRRSFLKSCAVGAGCLALNPSILLAGGATAREYPRLQLLNAAGEPLHPQDVEPGQHYVFSYPYGGTPCFLLNLGERVPSRNGLLTEGGEPYNWQGGVGPEASLVAYSAICAHKMAHPTPEVSYISFRPPRDRDEPSTGLISCCAENSRYDPFRGAEVLSGPATQPLAAILLEFESEENALYAHGTLGGELFQRFFEQFEMRLMLQHPNGDARDLVSGGVRVLPLEEYSRNVMQC
jgi:arsenite oxidase small subunit